MLIIIWLGVGCMYMVGVHVLSTIVHAVSTVLLATGFLSQGRIPLLSRATALTVGTFFLQHHWCLVFIFWRVWQWVAARAWGSQAVYKCHRTFKVRKPSSGNIRAQISLSVFCLKSRISARWKAHDSWPWALSPGWLDRGILQEVLLAWVLWREVPL